MNTEKVIRHVPARAPNGCSRQVMTQLTVSERLKLEEIAQLEMRSLSATCRMLMLRGVQQYEADTLAAQ